MLGSLFWRGKVWECHAIGCIERGRRGKRKGRSDQLPAHCGRPNNSIRRSITFQRWNLIRFFKTWSITVHHCRKYCQYCLTSLINSEQNTNPTSVTLTFKYVSTFERTKGTRLQHLHSRALDALCHCCTVSMVAQTPTKRGGWGEGGINLFPTPTH